MLAHKYAYHWLQGNAYHDTLSPKETFVSNKFQFKDTTMYTQEVFSEIIQLKLHQPILLCPTTESLAWESWKSGQLSCWDWELNQIEVFSYVISFRGSRAGAFSIKYELGSLKIVTWLTKGVFINKKHLAKCFVRTDAMVSVKGKRLDNSKEDEKKNVTNGKGRRR